jgi:hypothetical protein
VLTISLCLLTGVIWGQITDGTLFELSQDYVYAPGTAERQGLWCGLLIGSTLTVVDEWLGSVRLNWKLWGLSHLWLFIWPTSSMILAAGRAAWAKWVATAETHTLVPPVRQEFCAGLFQGVGVGAVLVLLLISWQRWRWLPRYVPEPLHTNPANSK